MNHALVLALCLAGFAGLAGATERQQEVLFGRLLAPPHTRLLWRAGWGALPLALAAAVGARGWSLGLVVWTGHLSLAAATVFVALLRQGRHRR